MVSPDSPNMYNSVEKQTATLYTVCVLQMGIWLFQDNGANMESGLLYAPKNILTKLVVPSHKI